MTVSNCCSLRAVAALLALAGLAGHAFADKHLTPDMLRDMPPQQVKAYVLAQVQAQAQRRAQASPTDTDVTPPVLTKFSLAAAAQAGGFITGNVALTDDLSGISDFYAYGYGPNGQFVSVSLYENYPGKKESGTVSGSTNVYTQAGDYLFDYAYAYDAAGNYSSYDAAALAALGNNVVSISNSAGVDVQPPTLLGGKILTAKVSLSAFQPGTTLPAYAGVEVRSKDTGDTLVSGIRYASAAFCLLDGSSCFYLNANPRAAGKTASVFQLGSQPVYYGVATGEFHLRDLYLSDMANNSTSLTSTEFGGSTDFKLLFPSVVITLKP